MTTTIFLFLTLFLGYANSQSDSIGCFVQGQCQDSDVVQSTFTDDVDQCLAFCKATSGCDYFSYHLTFEICDTFSDCVTFNSEADEYLSGEERCQPNQCFYPGHCDGAGSSVPAASGRACRDICLGWTEDSCEFFTFQMISDRGLCTITTDCYVTHDCDNCVYGKKDCHLPELSKLLLVGGYHVGGALDDAQILDMLHLEDPCTNDDYPANYPVAAGGLVAAMVNNVPWICGGAGSNECRNWDPVNNAWPLASSNMLENRFVPVAASIKDGFEWWITGGQRDSEVLNTTEILRDGIFVSGPYLPQSLHGHCLVAINYTHVFLAGGSNTPSHEATNNKAYVFNLDSPEDWQPVQDMSFSRFGHSCNLIRNRDDELEVVVAGGDTTSTDIYSLPAFTVRSGPEFPYPVHLAATVPFQDSFLVIGGRNGPTSNEFYRDIYKYDVGEEGWSHRVQAVDPARDNFAALMLPDEMVTCSKKV